MSVERKRKNGSWGFRFSQAGSTYKKYGYRSRAEAKAAEIQFRTDLKNNPPLLPTALVSVVGAYLIDSAEEGRSLHRLDALRCGLKRYVLGYFGEAKPIDEITFEEIRKLVIKLKHSGLKPKSVWHVVANLRSTLNYAIGKKLLRENPINRISSRGLRSIVGSTKSIKPPMDMAEIDRAAQAIKNPVDRAWFEVTRFTGMRKDEANRLQWADIRFDAALIHIPGTKTEDSDSWLPLAPVALHTLKELHKHSDSNCPWVFPGRSHRTKGKKVYSRRCLFESIQRVTAIEEHLRHHPESSYKQALQTCKKEKFKGGTRLKPKDLRDYFATEVASKVNDPIVIMKLLRHTNLKTTTNYLRTVENRLRKGVQNLGASSGGDLGARKLGKTSQNFHDPDTMTRAVSLAKLLIEQGYFGDLKGDIESGEIGGTWRSAMATESNQKDLCRRASLRVNCGSEEGCREVAGFPPASITDLAASSWS